MRILIVIMVVAALAGVGAANMILLGYGADQQDPVGRLSPILHVAPPATVPAPPGRHAGPEGPDD